MGGENIRGILDLSECPMSRSLLTLHIGAIISVWGKHFMGGKCFNVNILLRNLDFADDLVFVDS